MSNEKSMTPDEVLAVLDKSIRTFDNALAQYGHSGAVRAGFSVDRREAVAVRTAVAAMIARVEELEGELREVRQRYD